ncbi:hypothetical protein LRHMDP2_1370 [Lacticaseibacillus rhamnosus LRHMDP2]|uniref:Uncharacterized protein n=1 Tax=Lacticaseibacillus rhamnosus LRHMDP3 TaxID=1203259 RepID=A0AB33XUX1_LACRH|nr:hypothetical protein LRHMDP3_1479 [Lacticaseibacillus rhamnosus LRHMDP3]EKS51588.1 hypothetical protein LRHMDP2_1370 [Lacticaseibacillus rhamnosus LRHMDP2]
MQIHLDLNSSNTAFFTQADGLGFFVPVIRRKTERVVK